MQDVFFEAETESFYVKKLNFMLCSPNKTSPPFILKEHIYSFVRQIYIIIIIIIIITCMLIDVAISGDRNVTKKEAEKILKCKDVTIEIQCMWTIKARVMPVVIGAIETI
jgi:hypothetical protein